MREETDEEILKAENPKVAVDFDKLALGGVVSLSEVVKVDIENISTALDLYRSDAGQYPTTQQGLAALVARPTVSPFPARWDGPYLDKLPADPWGRQYKYLCPAKGDNPYALYSVGPDGRDKTGDDIRL